MKKKIYSIFLSFVLVLSSIFVSKPFDKVFALEYTDFNFANSQFSNNESNILNCLSLMRSNNSIDLTDYYCFISSFSSGSIFLLKKSSTTISAVGTAQDYYCSSAADYYSIIFSSTNIATFRTSHSGSVPFSELASYDFTNLSVNTGYSCDVTLYNSGGGGVGKVYDGLDSLAGKSYEFWQAAQVVNYSFNLGVVPFTPNFIGPYKGINLDFDPNGFYDWIIDNNKLTFLPSYIIQSKLLSFLNFYKEFGSSYTSFSSYIHDWFSQMNIANQTSENIQILKNSIDELYRQYISNYIVTFYPNTKNHFHHRQNIDTNTDDSNTTLITDDPTDTTNTSILRDILRGIIAISNNINSNFQALWDKLNNIDFTVSVVNNGGSVPAPSDDSNIDYTDQGDFGIDEIHQYEPLPEAPDIDGDVDFLEYPAVLAQSTNAFFNLLPSEMSALMSAVLVLGVLITKIGR